MITRSLNNGFKVQDWTPELAMIDNVRTPLSDLGIFRTEPVSQRTVAFEQTFGTLGLIGDVQVGGNVLANQDETRKIHTYAIPYHKVIDQITQADVQGQRAYGQANQAETKALVMARKATRMKRSAQMTQEYAKFFAITQGKVWTPNNTVAPQDFYADFGVTRKEINFALSSAGTDVIAKIEEVIAHIQDNSLSGDAYTGVVGLCSPEFFSALIGNAKVQTAYQFYSSTQEIQRNRAGGATTLYREFTYGGILFREIRDAVNGQRFIPAGEAYFLPMNTSDTFVTYTAPSAKLDLANTLGEEQYLWVYDDQKGEKEELELEFSHIHLIRKPNVVVKGTTA